MPDSVAETVEGIMARANVRYVELKVAKGYPPKDGPRPRTIESDQVKAVVLALVEYLHGKGWTAAEPATGRFPASFVMAWPSGPVYCCERHVRTGLGIAEAMGLALAITDAEPGHECENCAGEAERRQA